MKSERKSKGKQVSPYLLVILSFVGVIFFGSFLLTLPFAHRDGNWGNYMDALFHATSATCVTGLSTYANGIGNELTLFGQIVMLVMIQIGGLGFITILTFFVSLIQRKLLFKDRYMLAQAVNSTSIADVGKFVRRVIVIVVTAETIGFGLGLPVFLNVPGYTTGQAVWASIFTSISAFNNAGFDIFGSTSLIREAGTIMSTLPDWAYYYMQAYIMILIIMGGLSFLTIIEITFFRKKFRQLSSFAKITLLMTFSLIVLGFGALMLTDGISGNITPLEALFQSVTTRTAGFSSFNQATLSPGGKTISCVLMFIGGSPISTAGGIKTTTIFVLILCFVRFLQGRKISAFKREFTNSSIIKTMTLVFLSVVVLLVGYISIASFERGNTAATTDAVLYETFSAFGTVGLTENFTTTGLAIGSKITLCLLMFFGRLGPITLFQIFQTNLDNEKNTHYREVPTDVIIG